MYLRIDNNQLIVALEGWERLIAFQRRVVVPISAVTQVQVGEPQSGFWDWRIPGTFIPGLIKAGTYYSKRGREFWYVTRPRFTHCLILELSGHRFVRVILSPKDPEAWRASIAGVIRPNS